MATCAHLAGGVLRQSQLALIEGCHEVWIPAEHRVPQLQQVFVVAQIVMPWCPITNPV